MKMSSSNFQMQVLTELDLKNDWLLGIIVSELKKIMFQLESLNGLIEVFKVKKLDSRRKKIRKSSLLGVRFKFWKRVDTKNLIAESA